MTAADPTPEQIAEDFEIPYGTERVDYFIDFDVDHEEFRTRFAAALRAYGDARAAAERAAILRTLQLLHDEHAPTHEHANGVADAIDAVRARSAARAG